MSKVWIYQGKEIRGPEDIPEEFRDSYGFVYNIVTSEGKEYIGQKRLGTKRKKYVSQKYLRENGKKGLNYTIKKNKRAYYIWDIADSNWVDYTGSSAKLNKDIEEGIEITKYIIEFCESKTLLNYKEHKNILCTGALEHEKFYNDYSQIKVFKKNIVKSFDSK